MDHFRECFDRQVAATDELLRNFLNGPAPKEEEMKFTKTQCAGCGTTLLNLETCQRCVERTAERRAVARDAYMAALSGMPRVGMESSISIDGLVKEAWIYAIETVRRWDSFLAAVDAEGGE